jgi:hypothetical protein
MKGMIRLAWLEVLAGIFSCHLMVAQPKIVHTENYAEEGICQKTGQNVRILFWNVENLFDHRDDTVTSDEAFTSAGSMHWTYSKLQKKIGYVAKTIIASGEWNPPVIVGMCEVENRYVLNKLIYQSPLKPFDYGVIHRDSPDKRGIDVAMLYRKKLFTLIYNGWIPIRFPFDTTIHTREILYVKGLLVDTDTIHLFINHWPSRRGGEAASAPRRKFVAEVLRRKVDSILNNAGMQECSNAGMQQDTMAPLHHGTTAPLHHFTRAPHHPRIIIMGDFNDEPENSSLKNILRARLDTVDLQPDDLVNIIYLNAGKSGSHKYREHWGLLDQFIVSGILLDMHQVLYVKPNSTKIFKPGFLLEYDQRYLDKKPKRTYLGPRYKGGFSDHLPILMDIDVQDTNRRKR